MFRGSSSTSKIKKKEKKEGFRLKILKIKNFGNIIFLPP